jgi:membrane protease YdiL (CAAX protease family)
MLRRHRLALFFVLAFLLSWYPWFLALARGTTTGPNPLGPFAAALIVTAIAYGKGGLKELLGKLVRWKVGLSAYFVAIGLPIVLCALAAGAAAVVSPESVRITDVRALDVAESFLFVFLFIGLGEEPGWRGFALPELLQRHSPTIATLILASVWAVWHLPLIGTEFPLAIVPAFLFSLFGATFVQTWLFERTKGSLLLQMILHATVNTIGSGVVYRWFSGGGLLILWWLNAALWIVTGLVLTRSRDAAASAPFGPRFARRAP